MCFSDPSVDPRPHRVIDLCVRLGFDIAVLGYPPRTAFPVSFYFPISPPLLDFFHKVLRKLWIIIRSLSPSERWRVFCEKHYFNIANINKKTFDRNVFDFLIIEDLNLLPIAFEIKKKEKIIFDAREYYPSQNEGDLWFDLFEKSRRIYICKNYLTRCDAVVTVSDGLRREFLNNFHVHAEVYRSAPFYVDSSVRLTSTTNFRMVYHGVANRNRRLENLIKILSLLDERFSLDLILTGNPRYQQELRKKASGMARVAFPDPVPFEDIIQTIEQYDIGLFYCEPTTFNLKHCLPNKFFEYIQARLMIAIGPSPDMAELVKKYECGVVAEDFSVQSMANALNSLTATDIDAYKWKSHMAARVLCFEKESEKMVALFDRLSDENLENDEG